MTGGIGGEWATPLAAPPLRAFSADDTGGTSKGTSGRGQRTGRALPERPPLPAVFQEGRLPGEGRVELRLRLRGAVA